MNATSVVAASARWRAAFVIAFLVLLLIKFIVAATLSPFGDEAFYWQESRHLAWGYSDLPPLTAWLIRLGEAFAGHGLLGMRWPFLLLGSALPWMVVSFARYAFDERAGWQAGLLSLAMPLAGSLGVLALPDVPLTVSVALAMSSLLRAMGHNRLRDWLLLGFALAVAWLTHYRAGMLMLAGLLLLVLTARGRRQWTRSGLWIAILICVLGMVPLLISNRQQHGAGLAFQLIERNPWRFHTDALVQPLEQALACTPLLYGLLLWAAWQSWRRRGTGPWDLIAVSSLSFIVIYFAAGLFADDTRFRAHWPLPGYLPLLAALPVLLRERIVSRGWRTLAVTAFALAALGQVGCMAYVGMAAYPGGASVLAGMKAFPANFVGWRESAATTRALLITQPSTVLVADNFMMAAELDFAFDGQRPVYVLDSPLNDKHGRAPQLAIWGRDEHALRNAYAGVPVLLVVDELALRERERADWLGSVCKRVDSPKLVDRLTLYDGRKRIAFYRGVVPVPGTPVAIDPANCVVWRDAWMATSRSD